MSTMGLLSSGLGSSFTTSSYVGTSSPIPSTPWEEGGREGRGGEGGKRGEREGKGEREGRGERVEEGGQKEVVKFSTESCSSV